MFRISGFQQHDLTQLYELDQLCFPPDIAYSMEELRYFLSRTRCSCWVAREVEEKLAGFIIVERVRRQDSLTGHIITLDIAPDLRRRGLGKLLMQTAEKTMKEEGAGLIRLEVAVNNRAALEFYRHLGFAGIGRIPKYYSGRLDAQVMEKSI